MLQKFKGRHPSETTFYIVRPILVFEKLVWCCRTAAEAIIRMMLSCSGSAAAWPVSIFNLRLYSLKKAKLWNHVIPNNLKWPLTRVSSSQYFQRRIFQSGACYLLQAELQIFFMLNLQCNIQLKRGLLVTAEPLVAGLKLNGNNKHF